VPQPALVSGKRIPELDGIRGIAVLLVVIWHYVPCQIRNEAGFWVPFARRSLYLTGSGVDLFFVLSGFLIVGILVDERGAGNYLKVFYLRRACRILPLYFLLLTLFVWLGTATGLPAPSHQWLFGNPLPVWSYATFTQNIVMGLRGGFGAGFMSITWSLAVEEQFYLVMPLLVLLLGGRKLAWVLPLGLIAVPLMRLGFPGFHAYVNTPWRADPLLAGGCVALLVRSARFAALVRRNPRRLAVVGGVLLAVVPLMILYPGCLGVWDLSWLAVSYSLLVLAAALGMYSQVWVVLRYPALMWLGKLSYGIYMFHQAASGLLHGWLGKQAPQIANPRDMGITLLALLATLAAAWTSYRIFESPILRFGHRFRYYPAPGDHVVQAHTP